MKAATRIGVLTTVLALVTAACGVATPDSRGASPEAIRVHGNWTIDVYDEDGSLSQHLEFSNELLPSGATALVRVLSSAFSSSGVFNIVVFNDPLSTGVDPCGTEATPEPCVIGDTHAEYIVDEGRILLTGDFTADIDGHLGNVKTVLFVCSPDCEPVDFTATDAPRDPDSGAILTVSAGQSVDVQVDISFGTATTP